MARKVIWTPQAEADLLSICEYLDREWGDRVRTAFLDEVDEVIGLILSFPNMYRNSGFRDVREAVITRHNILFYRIAKDAIYLLSIWDTRQDPERRPL